MVEKSDINIKSYPVQGNSGGKSVRLSFPFHHNYRITFNCLTDTDHLRDLYNNMWEKIINQHKKNKNPSKKLLGKWRKDVKTWIASDVERVRKSFTARDIRPIECWDGKSGGAISFPLKHGWSKKWGTPKSINSLHMTLQRVE